MDEDALADQDGAESPRLYRLRRAAELRVGVDVALRIAAHHGLHDFIARALAEIDEANQLLKRANVSARPALLTIIDMDLALAEYRLRAATLAMTVYGPDVADIG